METQQKLKNLVDQMEVNRMQLQHSNQKLLQQNTELEQFNKIAVDRELRMIEMKSMINTLLEELGREPLYDLSSLEGKAPA